MVVEVDNHMPVQLDKISQYLAKVKREQGVKIYGFCQSNVTLGTFDIIQSHTICFLQPTRSTLCPPLSFSFKEELSPFLLNVYRYQFYFFRKEIVFYFSRKILLFINSFNYCTLYTVYSTSNARHVRKYYNQEFIYFVYVH